MNMSSFKPIIASVITSIITILFRDYKDFLPENNPYFNNGTINSTLVESWSEFVYSSVTSSIVSFLALFVSCFSIYIFSTAKTPSSEKPQRYTQSGG
jgi:hypothetical protein